MRVVILGGGFGGVNAALWLGDKLEGTSHEVILVTDKPDFLFRPSLIWVPFSQREIKDIMVPLHNALEKAGVQFINNKVKRIFPKENRVQVENQMINYDFLVLATGGLPDFDQIDGLQEHTSSVYHPKDALKTRERVRELESGASIVIGAAQGNPGPAISYEFLFELHTYLQQHEIKANITYFTYEKELFEQAGDQATKHLQKHMQEKEIPYFCNVTVKKVENNQVFLDNGISIPYSFSLILPPYKGADCIFSSNDIDHNNGLISVNSYLQCIQWGNIYAVGDTNLIKDKQVIKNGRAAELQATVAAENIYSRLQGQAQQKEYKDSFVGMMELGTDGGLLMIKYPNAILGRKFLEWASDGEIPHLMKVAFEKYYLWKLG